MAVSKVTEGLPSCRWEEVAMPRGNEIRTDLDNLFPGTEPPEGLPKVNDPWLSPPVCPLCGQALLRFTYSEPVEVRPGEFDVRIETRLHDDCPDCEPKPDVIVG